jgi:tetratricopeptide (TPR) repeat protein
MFLAGGWPDEGSTALRTLLKALGLTIWGLIAFGLLILFVFVGYQAAMKFRNPIVPAANTPNVSGQTDGSLSASSSGSDTVARTTQDQNSAGADSSPLNLEATHKLLRSAADQHQYEAAIGYGKQIYDSGHAGPDDLLFMAQAYASIKDCPNALTWVDRANDAFQAAAREADESLNRIKSRCESDIRHRPIAISAEQRERMTRLLNSFRERAEADRKNLPQLDANAAKSKFGQPDVRLGELYFGFGDYEHAIVAIQRGLEKGQVTHLDDAYVYLGRSQVAVGNIADARKSFSKLKDVPNISPRVLLLWELYADTLK